jgi:iron-sulfur cluster repair protein YtfE (RIC family)
MMKPSEARKLLLEQHGRLRELFAAAEELAARLLAGEMVGDELRCVLTDLRNAFAEHNASEERVLDPLLSAGDAWAPLRVKRMVEEHTAEHAAFREALTGETVEVAARIADLAEDVDAHMQAEERTFLSAAVLRDDVINLEDGS